VSVWWLLLYPAASLLGLAFFVGVYVWETWEPKRRARRLLAEDREVAALDAIWELPAREHA
jgi:hypothetical protein